MKNLSIAVFMIVSVVTLAACGSTWEGVKEDSKEIGRGIGEAAEDAGKAIKEAVE